MFTSNPKRKSTKAGIALTAEARSKLQQLADWIERELEGNQNPLVRLEYYGGVVTFKDRNCTYVSPMGALVQMFQPFTLADAKKLRYGVYRADHYDLAVRVANILGITMGDYLLLTRYLYNSPTLAFASIAKTLRTLK
jgi:hypothetical protein